MDYCCSKYLSKVSSASLEAVSTNGDRPLNLIGLQYFENFGEWKDVHHFAHHILVVVVVLAKITSETVDVLFAAPFFISKVGEILQNPVQLTSVNKNRTSIRLQILPPTGKKSTLSL